MDYIRLAIEVVSLLVVPFAVWLWKSKPDHGQVDKKITDAIASHDLVVDKKIADAAAADTRITEIRDKLWESQIEGLKSSLADIKETLKTMAADLKQLFKGDG